MPTRIANLLSTGLRQCYDAQGREISCAQSGQDAEWAMGLPWPDQRFQVVNNGLVLDRLTGLFWPRNANMLEFPISWTESLEAVAKMNRERFLGVDGWRLPNRRELRSLISHGSMKPALPQGHPFENIFLGWYWTSTTSAMATSYAWYIHLEGGRMFYGRKDQECLVWPVRGESPIVPATGQRRCYDAAGGEMPCAGSGQDGELLCGVQWPEPRFEQNGEGVLDRLTGLVWMPQGLFCPEPVDWLEALEAVGKLNAGKRRYRLPNINELESLVDAQRHSPALPLGHLFVDPQEAYWSSTTSYFEPDWAYVLYLHKGAVGVGYKPNRIFHCMAVRGPLPDL